jgi:hypothetical protein
MFIALALLGNVAGFLPITKLAKPFSTSELAF